MAKKGKPQRSALRRKPAGNDVWVKFTAPDCGWIQRNSGPPLTRAQIKRRVLAVAAQPTGSPMSPSTPDDTPVTGGLRVGNGDQIWPLAQNCMTDDDRFSHDGLRIQRLNMLDKGKTLGGFVDCIQCCYEHLKAV